MAAQAISNASLLSSSRNVSVRSAPRRGSRAAVRPFAAHARQEESSTVNGVQKLMNAGAKTLLALSAAQLMASGAAFALEPPNKNENADFGPNEVDTKKIEEVSVAADNPYDTAAPGRSGTTFGQGAPGNDTKDGGAVNEDAVKDDALKASSVVDKVKGLLPFQTLPVFDLASDTADLGPNEVTKDSIKDVAENVKDGIDTASPGRAGTVGGKAGQSAPGGDVGDLKNKAEDTAKKAKGKLFGLFHISAFDLADSGADVKQAAQDVKNSVGNANGGGQDILEKGIRGALDRAPDNLSNPKGSPYTEKAAEAIQGVFKQ
ncbi:hypothetical protein CVIRNUC_001236 [Coccomyxa viridis]|uniref:Uncharacterized protein n=1 Tax=Coccomyxa viridis TaxID=1274662 RepID=A0AAV1HTG9_9CHLO|nr:hypothetical protein CVIRNUC_001236 [Coccomyxa viridis]